MSLSNDFLQELGVAKEKTVRLELSGDNFEAFLEVAASGVKSSVAISILNKYYRPDFEYDNNRYYKLITKYAKEIDVKRQSLRLGDV